MEIKKGIAVSPGVAIAPAVMLESEEYRIGEKTIPAGEVPAELQRLASGFDESLAEVNLLRDSMARQLGQDIASIFDFHYGVLSQIRLREQIASLIQQRSYSAAFAAREVLRGYQRRFLNMEDELLRERVRDIRDIERRLLRHLCGVGAENLAHLTEPAILIAHDLTPSQSANLGQTKVVGVAMDAGGLTSHTAIVVRSMGIPAVMGLNDVSEVASSGDTIILDGTKGLVIIRPDQDMLAEYRAEEERMQKLAGNLIELRDKPAVTQDGVKITLLSNIEFPYEAKTSLEKGAEGIGLYRTEFLYLRSEAEPTEEEHYEAYTSVIRAVGDLPVTIRTLDLGADKYTQSQGRDPERNPFLGLRSIRYCLQNLEPFKVQLRAMLRASIEGDVRIMFPLISSLMELRQAKMALGDAMEDLEELGVPFRRNLPVGIMVETPAAALQIRELMREVDFISIGTNDLIQYMLAIDRVNDRIAHLYEPTHPAVVRILKHIVDEAHRKKLKVSVCGEMAGDPVMAPLLLGLGVDELSMSPPLLPAVKYAIRAMTLADARALAGAALSMGSGKEILALCEQFHRARVALE